ncbi:flavin reductase family protein [Palleronia caenipelagi]|uniref:Flavin reductase family protein n=1 Tax=Palleronia caenipelagi TaxID=2489174 RepID=A0A547Q9F6_9RHOB|nr:flavin reductase family protein [Palleronia caenipelagi]TRD23035.1 flavin reductase family protein [Palleronia caenipelagi]
MSDMVPFTPEELRAAFGRYATGVTVITTCTPEGPLGITANSFSSVSLDPPLLMWMPAKSSRRYRPFTECTRFAVHVMAAAQKDTSSLFVRDGNPFDQLHWHEGPEGTPLIEGCLARFLCETYAVHDAGDHSIVLGRILDAEHQEGPPLVFAGGKYGAFSEH